MIFANRALEKMTSGCFANCDRDMKTIRPNGHDEENVSVYSNL